MRKPGWCVLVGLLAGLPWPGASFAAFSIEDVFAEKRTWVGGTNVPSWVQLTVDGQNRPHAVIKMPGPAVYYAMRTTSGWHVERIDSAMAGPSATGDNCSIALGPDDSPHVVYWDVRPGANSGHRLYYNRRGPLDINLNWPNRQVIANQEISVRDRTSIAVDTLSGVHLAYQTPYVAWYAERSPAGIWSVPMGIDTIAATAASLALDVGNPLIAYNHSTRVYLARRNGGVWTKGLLVDPPSNSSPVNPSLSMTASGEPGIAFTLSGGRLGHIAHAFGSWLPYKEEHVGGRWPCLAYGALDVPTILHHNGTRLVFTKAYGEWTSAEVSSDGSTPGEPVREGNFWIAVDGEGRSHILYQVPDDEGMIIRYAVQTGVAAVDEPAAHRSRAVLSIAPNPVRADAEFSITLERMDSGPAHLEVVDLQGRLLLDRDIEVHASGPTVIRMTVPGARAGIYSLRVSTPRGLASRKIVLLP